MGKTVTRCISAFFLALTLSWHPESACSQIVRTGVETDLAIAGSGWFMVREPDTGQMYVTRSGSFFLDWDGYLVSATGTRVQGWRDPQLSMPGDLQFDANGAPPGTAPGAQLTGLRITADGKLHAILSDGTRFVRGQVLLENFSAPGLLSRVAHNLYSLTAAAGPLGQPGPPGSPGLGTLLSGWLDLTPEPVQLSLLPDARQTGPLTEGVLTLTSLPTDLAVVGPGFFLVRDTNTSALFATRAGLFLRDAAGYLITYDRRRVQGYCDVGLLRLGDVQIDAADAPEAAAPSAVFSSFCVNAGGQVQVVLSDGTLFTRGQVLLWTFAHPECLAPTNLGLYANVVAARLSPAPATSTIQEGALELINVSPDLVALRQTLNLSTQGPITPDQNPTHLAVDGTGFFLLRDPGNDSECVTRVGAFQLDSSSTL